MEFRSGRLFREHFCRSILLFGYRLDDLSGGVKFQYRMFQLDVCHIQWRCNILAYKNHLQVTRTLCIALVFACGTPRAITLSHSRMNVFFILH